MAVHVGTDTPVRPAGLPGHGNPADGKTGASQSKEESRSLMRPLAANSCNLPTSVDSRPTWAA
jgi:hypothetical protein